MARPTKFKPEYTQKLLKFFDVEPYKEVIAKQSKEYLKDGTIKKESVEYRNLPNKMPTLYRFSRKIGVKYKTIWQWAEKGKDEELEKMIDSQMLAGKTEKEAIKIAKGIKEFSNAYNEAKELQKEFLINLGLAGAAPPAFAIFTAKNVTDMRDTKEVEHSGEVTFLTDEQRKNILKREARRIGLVDN